MKNNWRVIHMLFADTTLEIDAFLHITSTDKIHKWGYCKRFGTMYLGAAKKNHCLLLVHFRVNHPAQQILSSSC